MDGKQSSVPLYFPDITYREKQNRLLEENGTLKHPDRVGLVADLLVQDKRNAQQWIKAVGNMSWVRSIIIPLVAKFPLVFIVSWFDVMEVIPCRQDLAGPNAYRAYFFGAANREYRQWSADVASAKHQRLKERGTVLDDSFYRGLEQQYKERM